MKLHRDAGRLPLLCAFASALPLSAQEKPVPVVDEPMHRTVFETSLVRVIDVQIQPGKTTLYHRHVIPSVIIYLTRSTIRSESWPNREILLRDLTPGQSRYAPYDKEPLAHRVTNTGAGPFRVLDIELLNRPTANSALAPLASPHAKLQWEERLARSSQIILAAGTSITLPAQRAAPLVVSIRGSVRVTASNASADKPRILTSGDFQYLPPQSQLEISNAGAEPAEVVLLELKT